jgi:hypothetical protein
MQQSLPDPSNTRLALATRSPPRCPRATSRLRSRTVAPLRPRTWPVCVAESPASVRKRNMAVLRTCETRRARLGPSSTSRRTPERAETTSRTASGFATSVGIATGAQSVDGYLDRK